MNNYFRLLFVGSILFVLLGLFHKQSGNKVAQNIPAGELEHMEFQSGLLPVLARMPSIPSNPSNSSDLIRGCIFNSKGYENQFSIKIGDRLVCIESEFSERKPEMISKTGLFLHLPKGKIETSIQ